MRDDLILDRSHEALKPIGQFYMVVGSPPAYIRPKTFYVSRRFNRDHAMPRPKKESAYTEITLQQLRSFCETARLGSFTAAAASLGLAHPTVWQQVHAVEREFGEQLGSTQLSNGSTFFTHSPVASRRSIPQASAGMWNWDSELA
jgi:hypothetical protein